MKKIVTTNISVSLLLLFVICGGCNQLTPTEQAELERIYDRVGSRDLSARSDDGFDRGTGSTALHFAASEGSLAVVRHLVSKGADLDALDPADCTPLHGAVAGNKNIEVIKYLLSKKKGGIDAVDARSRFNLLHVAASNENVEIIKFIASKGHESKVNAKDADGNTPLHWAASNTNVEVAKFLVSNGADAKIRNKEGKTPLDTAREWLQIVRNTELANPEVVQYLSGLR